MKMRPDVNVGEETRIVEANLHTISGSTGLPRPAAPSRGRRAQGAKLGCLLGRPGSLIGAYLVLVQSLLLLALLLALLVYLLDFLCHHLESYMATCQTSNHTGLLRAKLVEMNMNSLHFSFVIHWMVV